VVGTFVGLAVASVLLVALGLWAWVSSGGTFGGYGAAADSDLDRGAYEVRLAVAVVVAVLSAVVVPITWAVVVWKRGRDAGPSS
jgi:hypothetical protein